MAIDSVHSTSCKPVGTRKARQAPAPSGCEGSALIFTDCDASNRWFEIMTRSALAQNTQAQQRECEVLQRYELGEFSLSLDDSAPELCGVNRSK